MNTYNIMVLGARGSGKTVFLASMYHKLSTQSEDNRFHLSVPDNQRKILLQKYHEVADISRPWPESTRLSDISQWTFTCRVRSEGRLYDVLVFNYWDYAGEILTDYVGGGEGSERIRFVEEQFRNADALLGLLDGDKISSFMLGQPHPAGSITSDLDHILSIMEDNKNPVHFVITKWDLLQDQFSLEAIRNKLLEYRKFSEAVYTRLNDNIPVRLIPVSAVGSGFAELHTNNGNFVMQKVPGAVPIPFQVDAPLACVFPDKLRTELGRMKERESELWQKEVVAIAPNLTIWDSLGALFGGAIKRIREALPLKWQFADAALKKLEEFSESGAYEKEEEAVRRTEQLRRERDEALTKVRDEESAHQLMIDNFLLIAQMVRRDFPTSDLSRRV